MIVLAIVAVVVLVNVAVFVLGTRYAGRRRRLRAQRDALERKALRDEWTVPRD